MPGLKDRPSREGPARASQIGNPVPKMWHYRRSAVLMPRGMNAGTSRRALASALQLREPMPTIRYCRPSVCLTLRRLEYLESGFLPDVVQPEFPAISTGCGCRT